MKLKFKKEPSKKMALVKSTGETMKIEAVWSFDFKDNEFPGNVYELSDKKKYKKEELILGIDNIREYKIKKITK